MLPAELKGKTVQQLHELLVQFKKELFNLRFQKATGQLQDGNRVKAVRKAIARINTFLTQKQGENHA